jgi:5-methyltetrahydropteroyltriglutamate--homocysteine methyltransferase
MYPIQERTMKPALLQTTIVGSLPKPAWLAEPEQLWAPWRLEGQALAEGLRDAVRLALRDQESAGIDIVSDGEQTRRHFVTTLIENLEGVDFQHKKTVRIRNRYDADVPMVVGPVARTRPIFAEHARFLRAETGRPVKFTLPGPMTMVDTLYDGYYKSREKLAREFASILNAEARELEALGVNVIQFDEPAFNVFMDEVRDWGVETLEAAAAGLKCKTAVHICYGYGIKANNDWKKTLGSEWRQYESTFPLLAKSKIDQVSLECANSKVPLELIALLRGKDIMVGAIDVASESIETPEQVAQTLRAALKHVAPEKLYPCTNCGMVPLPRAVARGKLNALAAGAAIVRKELAA